MVRRTYFSKEKSQDILYKYIMAGVCTSCAGMTGGAGVEFFEQNQLVANLAENSIKCQKDYNGCVYSAQGAIMCGLKQSNEVKKNDVKETFVPGMAIGGIPNIPALPNFKSLSEQNTNAPSRQFY
jgi:hypothetical protein